MPHVKQFTVFAKSYCMSLWHEHGSTHKLKVFHVDLWDMMASTFKLFATPIGNDVEGIYIYIFAQSCHRWSDVPSDPG